MGSLNVTMMLSPARTLVAPFAGETETTVGGVTSSQFPLLGLHCVPPGHAPGPQTQSPFALQVRAPSQSSSLQMGAQSLMVGSQASPVGHGSDSMTPVGLQVSTLSPSQLWTKVAGLHCVQLFGDRHTGSAAVQHSEPQRAPLVQLMEHGLVAVVLHCAVPVPPVGGAHTVVVRLPAALHCWWVAGATHWRGTAGLQARQSLFAHTGVGAAHAVVLSVVPLHTCSWLPARHWLAPF